MKINDSRIPWPEVGNPLKMWELPEDLELDTKENVEASSKEFTCVIPKGEVIPLKTYPNYGTIIVRGCVFTY